MTGIDFGAEDWHPTVDLPEFYDVLDLSGSTENVRMSEFSIGKYDEIRNIYTTELFAGGRTLHIGLDIGGPVGTPVMSVAEGTIAFSGYNAAEETTDTQSSFITRFKSKICGFYMVT